MIIIREASESDISNTFITCSKCILSANSKNIGKINVPIIVRLQGTNSKEAAEIINNSGLKVFSAITLQDAADKINDIL